MISLILANFKRLSVGVFGSLEINLRKIFTGLEQVSI